MTDDVEQTPEALENMKQAYLIEQSLQQSLRVLYGDRAVHETKRISKALAAELVKRGVIIIPIGAAWAKTGLAGLVMLMLNYGVAG